MSDRFMEDATIRTAAIVAHTFKIDPIVVLKSKTTDWMIRLASLKIVQEEQIKAQRAAQKKSSII